MKSQMHRRNFLSSAIGIPAMGMLTRNAAVFQEKTGRSFAPRKLKTSLNAYSFNAQLTAGTMTVPEMFRFCAENGFDAIDLTGYYLRGYPQVPPDDYLFDLKQQAFRLGLELSGTGVRNDFTLADKEKRAEEVKRVKNWIDAAAKLGAPVLRIFSGNQKNEGISQRDVEEWVTTEINGCVEYAKKSGIILGLQNHNDFIRDAEGIIRIMKSVNSPWLGIILDTGSFHEADDAYAEMQKCIPYAVSWQIKEKIFDQRMEKDIDLKKLVPLIKESSYRGYLPIEALGDGDPRPKILALLSRLQQEIN